MAKMLCDENGVCTIDDLTGMGVYASFFEEHETNPDLVGITIGLNYANGTADNVVDLQELLQSSTMYIDAEQLEVMRKELITIANNLFHNNID